MSSIGCIPKSQFLRNRLYSEVPAKKFPPTKDVRYETGTPKPLATGFTFRCKERYVKYKGFIVQCQVIYKYSTYSSLR